MWQGVGKTCRLDHPMTGSFNGIFANTERPVALHILGDSLGEELRAMLTSVLEHNTEVRHLRLVPPRSLMQRQLPLIPRSRRGCRLVLDSIDWQTNFTASIGLVKEQRVLLVSTGVWYNVLPYCDTREGDDICRLKMQRLDHDRVIAPHSSGGYRSTYWGQYNYARRFQGTATSIEYGKDVATLLEAIEEWQSSDGENITVVWLEPPPQHFQRPNSHQRAANCSILPMPLLPAEDDARHDGTTINASHINFFLAAACGIAPGPSLPASSESLQRCDEQLANWRMELARPVLARHDIAWVPTFQALSTRAELHTWGRTRDCTHWCNPSEATLYLAMATLNVVASLLVDQAQPQVRQPSL